MIYGPDQNPRGTDLEDFLFRHGLHVENRGTTPTFQNSVRSSFIDVTLTRDLPTATSGWMVDTRFNGSDNNTVVFSLALGFEYVPSSRPWDRADWGLFTNALAAMDIYVPSKMATKKLDQMVSKVNHTINHALGLCCPYTKGHQRDPQNPWFTQWVWDLRARVERLFQLKRRSPTVTNVSRFASTQSRYRKECKRRRRCSWRNHIEWTPGPRAASRLMCVLNRKETQNISTFLQPDGASTNPGADTADLLFRAHFPQSTPAFLPHYDHDSTDTSLIMEHFTDIVNITMIRESMTHFQAKKTPGPDGFKPVLLLYLSLPNNLQVL